MSVSLNWQPIVGGLILLAGAVFAGVQWWRSRPAGQQAAQTNDAQPDPQLVAESRKADEPPPVGGVAWVLDICKAMGTAKAESVLECLKAGATRDQARMARIAELEGANAAVKSEPQK